MKKLWIISALIVLQGFATAQQSYLKRNHIWGLQVSLSKNEFSPSIYWLKQHTLGTHKRLRIGYMLRFTSYFARKVPYQTAPAIYTSGQKGPQVIFKDNIPENIDTLDFYRAELNALNLGINLEYQIHKRFAAAFNIDIAGFSFGNDQSAYHSSNRSSTNATPTALNLLLISDNDIGSLNSEFLVKYYLNDKICIQAGFGFLFTEYTTDQAFKLGNKRFRNKSEMLTLGVSYTPNKTF